MSSHDKNIKGTINKKMTKSLKTNSKLKKFGQALAHEAKPVSLGSTLYVDCRGAVPVSQHHLVIELQQEISTLGKY